MPLRERASKIFCLPWHKLARIKYSRAIRGFQTFLIIIPIYVSFGAWVTIQTSGVFQIPIPANLLLLYFSSFMFFVGGTIFDMFCPNIVRTNKNFPAYYKDTQLLSLEIVSKYMEISKRKREALDSALEAASDNSTSQSSIGHFIDNWIEESNKLENLWHTREQWVNENHKQKKFFRITNTIFYYIGFSVLFWITAYDAPRRVLEALEAL